MDHAGAFVESIVEDPDDDAPRLIFADWLEDHDDSDRAEFIRLQVTRARLHCADPRVRACVRRENELLARHEAAWLGPLAVLASRCRFQRGFVEEVNVSVERFLTHGHEIFRLAPIRRVQLRGTSALPAFVEDPTFAERLAELLARVRVLDLNRERFNEAAGLALLQLPKLPRLEGLHLSDTVLSPGAVAVLAESPVLAPVRTLEFNTQTSRDSLELLLQSPHLRELEHLLLTGTSQGDRAVSLLHGADRFPNLRSLSLGHTNLTPAGLDDLLASPWADRLDSLDLSFNPLGVEGARALARTSRLRNLTWLNLSRIRPGNEGAAALASSPLFDRLRGIDLSMCRVGEKGGRALANAGRAAIPLTLDLIYNPLRADVRAALVRRFGEEVCLFTR